MQPTEPTPTAPREDNPLASVPVPDAVDDDTTDDGFGNVWGPCPEHGCKMQVVRPGKAVCPMCDAQHVIDAARKYDALITALRSLGMPDDADAGEWVRSSLACWHKPTPDMLFTDGDQYLVALQVRDSRRSDTLYWEYEVVTAHGDSETPVSFRTHDGDSWGWEWSDVEWFIPLSEFRLGSPKAKAMQALQQSLQAAEARAGEAERERDEARRAIESFGNNPNGFDWAFLTQLENAEDALTAATARADELEERYLQAMEQHGFSRDFLKGSDSEHST